MAHLQSPTPIDLSGTGTSAITFAGSCASGTLLTLAITQYFGSQPPRSITSVSDNVNSGNWTLGASNTANGGATVHQYYKVANATGTPTVTVVFSGAENGAMSASQYDSTYTVLDATNSAQGTGTSVAAGAVNPTGTAQYINAVCIPFQYIVVTQPGAPWASRAAYRQINGGNAAIISVVDQITSGSQNPTTTFASSQAWASSTMTFIAAGGGLIVNPFSGRGGAAARPLV